MFLVLYILIIWGNGMTEKTELDEATDELRKTEQRFSDYWNQTSDLNKILFNLEMDKIFKTFKIRCRYLEIEDKLKNLETQYKKQRKYSLIFGSFWALFIIGYILFYQTTDDKFITFLIVFGLIGIDNILRSIQYQNQKNTFTTILDVTDPSSDYGLAPGPTKHFFKNRHGNTNNRFMFNQGHLLFNYMNYNLGKTDLEKIHTETEIVRRRIRILHDIENDMDESKSLEQRQMGWYDYPNSGFHDQ
jgi:hypothetical protein